MPAYLAGMSAIQELERVIAQLPKAEFLKLREHMQRRFDADWDAQFERDVASGALSKASAKAIAEHRAGKSKPFPADEK
jgi:hypothetical protein